MRKTVCPFTIYYERALDKRKQDNFVFGGGCKQRLLPLYKRFNFYRSILTCPRYRRALFFGDFDNFYPFVRRRLDTLFRADYIRKFRGVLSKFTVVRFGQFGLLSKPGNLRADIRLGVFVRRGGALQVRQGDKRKKVQVQRRVAQSNFSCGRAPFGWAL